MTVENLTIANATATGGDSFWGGGGAGLGGGLFVGDSDGSRPGIPMEAGRGFRFDVGHRSDLKPATIPI